MSSNNRRADHRVHPRPVWAGLALALVGAAVVGLGVALLSWWLIAAGAIGVVVGTGLSIRGGVLYDARKGNLTHEITEVARGETHEGVAPGEMVHNPLAAENARRRDQERRRLLSDRARVPRPPSAPLGAMVLILTATVLLVAQWTLYPTGQTGQDNALRDLGCAIVAGLAGLRILIGNPGVHAVACGLAMFSGLVLVLGAAFVGHTAGAVVLEETVAGAFVLLAGAVCLASPER